MTDYERWFRAFNRNASEEYAKMYFAIINGDLIQKRLDEIDCYSSAEDVNSSIKAQNKNSDKVALVATKRATDTELNLYKEVKEKVSRALASMNEEQIAIIHMLYDVKKSKNKGRTFSRTISSVATELGLTTKEVKKVRNIFLTKIMS